MVKKILIVDDEEDILTSVKMLLESAGYKIKTAMSGKEALRILHKESFDLVLLDILMPKLSGRELLEMIRADPKLKKQKVAFLTVIRLSQAGVKAVKKLKPVKYFEKPIMDTADFKRKIKAILK